MFFFVLMFFLNGNFCVLLGFMEFYRVLLGFAVFFLLKKKMMETKSRNHRTHSSGSSLIPFFLLSRSWSLFFKFFIIRLEFHVFSHVFFWFFEPSTPFWFSSSPFKKKEQRRKNENHKKKKKKKKKSKEYKGIKKKMGNKKKKERKSSEIQIERVLCVRNDLRCTHEPHRMLKSDPKKKK